MLVLFCNGHMTTSQASRLGAHNLSLNHVSSLLTWQPAQHPHSALCKMPSSHCTRSSTCQALTLLHMLAARGARRRLLAKLLLLLLLLGDVGATLQAAGVRALLTACFLRAGSCARICTKSVTPSGTPLNDKYQLARCMFAPLNTLEHTE